MDSPTLQLTVQNARSFLRPDQDRRRNRVTALAMHQVITTGTDLSGLREQIMGKLPQNRHLGLD